MPREAYYPLLYKTPPYLQPYRIQGQREYRRDQNGKSHVPPHNPPQAHILPTRNQKEIQKLKS